jgi:primosomal protein N' (replication factor Y)
VAEEQASNLGSTAATQMRREKALRYLMQRPEALNVAWVYAESGCSLPDLRDLAERDLIVLREQEIWRDPLSGDPRSRPGAGAANPVILTAEQSAVWGAIEAAFQTKGAGAPVQSLLVEGVTGSGKTELYVRAAAEAVRMGKQVIVMVPEIALTPQTIDRFLAHFPGQVGLIHSGLSDGERYDTWRRARAGALQVIIGPRSALFAPLPRIGLLVVDECHDGSYYQSDPPFYDAVTAAQAYARYCSAVCIMGSATPSVVQRYDAQTGGSSRLVLSQRVASASEEKPAPIIGLPPVRIVDMREELKTGNRSSFSRELQDSLAGVLEHGEQAILFLNRRGTATYVFCRSCGYVVRCPRCDSPLTYHTSGGGRLLCHRCGYVRQLPKTCPQCGAADIRAYGLGTESVEAEVQRIWPRARTLRWDWETTRQKQAHEIILSHFARRKADVLIGTQMLAKGLDLPGVTLVGIVLADVGLFLPDPFAVERTFQLLTQVAGRAGRSTRGGKVILQTFAPTHHAIQAAARHDVAGFYQDELAQRRRLGYPPFSRLLRLEFRHYDPVKAQDEAQEGAAFLQARLAAQGDQRLAMIGPAPCFYSRLDGKYRWQIVLRGSGFQSLIDERRFKDWRIEADPISLL